MARFLIIDTALEQAIVALSNNESIQDELVHTTPHDHASFLQVAIAKLMEQNKLTLSSIDAIVVTLGPGSYTGLRVGLSSAKGIAYALQKPLIGLSTLDALAQKAIKSAPPHFSNEFQVFTMIDARRMEVFGAIYNNDLGTLVKAQAMPLDNAKWASLIQKPTICIGNGNAKTKAFIHPHEIYYNESSYTSKELLEMADLKFKAGLFEDLAYVGPNYLKEVYILPSK